MADSNSGHAKSWRGLMFTETDVSTTDARCALCFAEGSEVGGPEPSWRRGYKAHVEGDDSYDVWLCPDCFESFREPLGLRTN